MNLATMICFFFFPPIFGINTINSKIPSLVPQAGGCTDTSPAVKESVGHTCWGSASSVHWISLQLAFCFRPPSIYPPSIVLRPLLWRTCEVGGDLLQWWATGIPTQTLLDGSHRHLLPPQRALKYSGWSRFFGSWKEVGPGHRPSV